MGEESISLTIPRSLYEKIKIRVESSLGEFKSVEEYIRFVLEEVVKEEETYTSEEEMKVKERLKKLGYL